MTSGSPDHDKPWPNGILWFADLRPGSTYVSARPEREGLREVSVQALAIAYGGLAYQSRVVGAVAPPWEEIAAGGFAAYAESVEENGVVDPAPAGEWFLLVELDGEGEPIADWIEQSIEEAKAHGQARADAEATGLP